MAQTEATDALRVTVAYARQDAQFIIALRLARGATARDAIQACGLLRDCPEISLERNGIGVFGRVVDPDRPLEDGDRVEIYRRLAIDPKQARRHRASRRR